MGRSGALFYFLFFISVAAFSQNSSIDSLENLLRTAPKDSNRVKILGELSFKYLAYKPPLAKQYGEEALSLSKDLHFSLGEALALNRLGEFEFRQSNYAHAVELTTQSLKIAEQLDNAAAMANAYRLLGIINTLGFKQYDLALQFQLKALAIYTQMNDKRNIASFCGNITWIYAITNQNLKEAHRLAKLGAHLADSLSDDQLLSYNYNSTALIFTQEKRMDSALYYLDESIRFGKSAKDNGVIAYNKSIKGNIFLQQHNFKQSIELFNAALMESRKLNIRELQKDSYGGLAKSYEGLGNYPLAYRYHVLHTQLKDSLINLEITQRALMADIEFKQAKSEAKIFELEQVNKQAQQEKVIYFVLFGSAFLFMMIIIFLVVRNNRNRERTNLLLKEKNDEIAGQNLKLQQINTIKDKIFSIIGHDLRSPLVSLKGMLGLVMRNEISEGEFRIFAPKLNQLVIITNETLENLLQWSHSQMKGWNHTPTTFSLHALVQRAILLFAESAKVKNIELHNQLPKDIAIYADENQIELIFRNLIHNAIKYSSEGGIVSIVLNNDDQFHQVSVIDNGVGMSVERAALLFEGSANQSTRGTKGERGTGLGLMLCKEMAQNNGGHLKASSEEGKGSAFHVFLKQGL